MSPAPAIPPNPAKMPKGSRWLHLGTALAIWLTVLWGANRSFDFTDEGVYYLSAAHPMAVPDRQTTYYVFGHVLFALSGYNIIVTRVFVASLVLAATFVFVRGLRRFLAAFAPALNAGGWIATAAMGGTALAFSVAPVAPSYNLLNTICLLAAAGLVLEAAGAPTQGSLIPSCSVWLPLLAAAVLLIADFFIKFSTSIALVALLIPFFLITSRERLRHKGILGLVLLFAGLLALVGYFLLFQDLATWRRGIAGTLEGLSHPAFVQSELTRYANEIWIQFAETSQTYEPVFLALLIESGVLLILRRWPRVQRWFALLAAGIVCLVGYRAAPANFARTYEYLAVRLHVAIFLGLALAASLTWLVQARTSRPRLARGGWRASVALVLCLLLPLAGSFGTSNNIIINAIYQFAPWLAGIALLLEWLSFRWQAWWPRSAGVIFVSAVALSQFFNGYVCVPYRIPGGRLEQTVPTAIGVPATTLLLDAGSHDLVEGVRAQLKSHGFKPGDDILAFFNLPGLVFAVGANSPGYPWYFSGDASSLALDAMRVNWVPARRRYRSFVMLNRHPGDPPPLWGAMFMNFPKDYFPCGPVLHNPLTGELVEVWLPVSR